MVSLGCLYRVPRMRGGGNLPPPPMLSSSCELDSDNICTWYITSLFLLPHVILGLHPPLCVSKATREAPVHIGDLLPSTHPPSHPPRDNILWVVRHTKERGKRKAGVKTQHASWPTVVAVVVLCAEIRARSNCVQTEAILV